MRNGSSVAAADDRRAGNETLFREANEAIETARQGLASADATTPFLCECEDAACRELVPLQLDEYEAVRASPTAFLIVPGHPSSGKVVARHEAYHVVEKSGEAAQAAQESDPRADEPNVDARARRAGENEALFRQVNDQIRELDRRLTVGEEETYGFVCECADGHCLERIQLSIGEYERIHSDPTRFAVVDGHEDTSVETVVERREGYSVVRKHPGGQAELAARHHR